jgi:hypothetical protein
MIMMMRTRQSQSGALLVKAVAMAYITRGMRWIGERERERERAVRSLATSALSFIIS